MVTCPWRSVSIKGSANIIDPGRAMIFGTIKNSQIKKYGQAKISRMGTERAQLIKQILR